MKETYLSTKKNSPSLKDKRLRSWRVRRNEDGEKKSSERVLS